jgi:5,10-methylenetetrahydrofolate reductase
MLRDKIQKNRVITVEVLLPVSTDSNALVAELEPLREHIDAINIPSNPLGKLRPDSMCFGHIIQEELHIEAIPHFVARHYTLLIFESQLLGAHALGIKNILCVTGDSPVEGRSVFDLNGAKLLEIANNLRNGITSARRAIRPLDFCLCAGFNPNVPNIQGEFLKVSEKYHCGAEVFFTQPVFDPDNFVKILKEFRSRYVKAKIIAGLSFLYTKKRAFSLTKFLGIPFNYIKLIEEMDETDLLYSTAQKLKDLVDGFYIIPIGKYAGALPLVKKIRKLI